MQDEGSATLEDQVAMTAALAQCKSHFLDLQEITKKITPPDLDPLTAGDVETTKRKEAQTKIEAAHKFMQGILRHDPDLDNNADDVREKLLTRCLLQLLSAVMDTMSLQQLPRKQRVSTSKLASPFPCLNRFLGFSHSSSGSTATACHDSRSDQSR